MRDRGLILALIMLLGLAGPVAGQGVGVSDTALPADMRYKVWFSEGLKEKMLGNSDQAAGFFQRCIEVNPSSGAAYYELGLLSSQKKDYPAAAGYARNAWKFDPSNKWYGMLLIENLNMMGKFDETVDIFRQLQKIEPKEESFITGEIQALIQSDRYSEAVRKIRKLPKTGDLERWGIVKEKDIWFAQKKFDKGAEVMIKWLDNHPGDYEIRGILAEAFAAAGKKEEAAVQYRVLKEQHPDNPAVRFSLGQFLFQNGQKEEALEEFTEGFRSPDVNPSIKIDIIRSFLTAQVQQEKIDPEVVTLIRVLYEVDKGNPQVDGLYANYLYSEDKMDQAEPIYRKLIRTDPGNYTVWQNLLFILSQRQDNRGILQVADSALTYFPGQGLFYLFKGMALTEIQDYPAAIGTLNKGLGIPGQNADIIKQFYLSLAESLYKNGNAEEAFSNFSRMLALEPDNILVLNNYSYYLSLEGRDLDKALEMITKCIAKEPDNPTYLDTYAWVLYRRNEFGKALEPMEKAVRLSADPSGEVLEHYGDILFRNGKTAEAKQAWTKALGRKGASGQLSEKINNGLK